MKIWLLLTILGSNLADPIDSGLYNPDHSGLYQPDNSGQYLLDHTGLYVPDGLRDVEDDLEEEHESEDLKDDEGRGRGVGTGTGIGVGGQGGSVVINILNHGGDGVGTGLGVGGGDSNIPLDNQGNVQNQGGFAPNQNTGGFTPGNIPVQFQPEACQKYGQNSPYCWSHINCATTKHLVCKKKFLKLVNKCEKKPSPRRCNKVIRPGK